jgi:hypothetical protein
MRQPRWFTCGLGGFTRKENAGPSQYLPDGKCVCQWLDSKGKPHFNSETDLVEPRLTKDALGFVCCCEIVCEIEESNHCPVQDPKLILTQEVVVTR